MMALWAWWLRDDGPLGLVVNFGVWVSAFNSLAGRGKGGRFP